MDTNSPDSLDTNPIKLDEPVLPEDTATWVHIHYIDDNDGSIWAMLKSDIPVMDTISQTLNESDDKKRISNPVIDQVVTALNVDDTWYRARILGLEPHIRVQFIDFGDTSVVSAGNLAHLPPSLCTIHPLAMKIELHPDSVVRPYVGGNLLVKPVVYKTNVTVVDVLNEPIEGEPKGDIKEDFPNIKMLALSAEEPVNLSEEADKLLKDYHKNNGDGLRIESDSNTTLQHLNSSESSLVLSEDSLKDDKVELDSKETCGLLQTFEPEAEIPLSYSSDIYQEASVDTIINVNSSSESFQSTIHINHALCSENFASPETLKEQHIDSIPVQSIESSMVECAVSGGHSGGALSESSHKISTLPSASADDSEPRNEGDLKLENGAHVPFVPASSTPCATDNLPGSSESQIPPITKFEEQNTATPSLKTVRDLKQDESSSVLIEMSANELAENCAPSGTEKMCRTSAYSQRDNSDDDHKSGIDSFITALAQYPHLGGGYGSDTPQPQSMGLLDLGGAGDTQDKCSNMYPKSSVTKVGQGPTAITKGRNSKNTRPPPSQDISQTGSCSMTPKSSVPNLSFKTPLQKSSACNLPQDFKTILEFELAIIREQNRLQMLQLQKKMEQNLVNQMKALRDDTTKQLAVFRNEVNGRLGIINDSVVHKLADIYSDISTLKNDQELSRHTSVMKLTSSRVVPMNSGQMQQYQNLPPQQRPPHHIVEGKMQFRECRMDDNTQGKLGFMGNFQSSSQNQALRASHSHEKDNSMSTPANRLMSMRKEKMIERDHNNHYSKHQHNDRRPDDHQSERDHNNHYSKHQHNDRRPEDHQSNFSVGHYNPQNYPKMDHFDPSKMGLESDAQPNGNKSGSGNIICVNNLNAEKINPDLLFNLFGVYGNVLRVKISQQDRGRAFIEMSDPAQAEEAIRYLSNVRLMGLPLHISPCNFDQLKLSRQEFQSNTCKDFTKPQIQRLNRFKPGLWSPQKLFPPSDKLMIANVLSSVSDEKIKEEFLKNGFSTQSIFSQSCANDEKKIVFVTMNSVEEAVNALTVMHLQELSDWMAMRISFGKSEKR